jgi:class 3 adenylate cyclase
MPFRDNDIDADVLLKLTAEDLISIGVTSVGHQRKLLDAIDRVGMAVPTAAVAVPAPGAPAQVDAERRQLTVMFCDLVGSTALSTRHDPEDLRELIGDYHRTTAETVCRFDGLVAKYMGDGLSATASSTSVSVRQSYTSLFAKRVFGELFPAGRLQL